MHCYWTRFTVERASGYHLFFQTAIAGGFLLILAHMLISLGAFLHLQGSALWTSLVRFPYPGAAGLSALLGLLLPVVINLIIDYRYDGDGKEYAAERAAEESSDLIELLLAESMKRQVHVELSLRSGKSYIGLALKTGLGVNSESDIAIIPMLSGYRRQDTHELEITTDYAPVIWDFLERDDPGFGLAYGTSDQSWLQASLLMGKCVLRLRFATLRTNGTIVQGFPMRISESSSPWRRSCPLAYSMRTFTTISRQSADRPSTPATDRGRTLPPPPGPRPSRPSW